MEFKMRIKLSVYIIFLTIFSCGQEKIMTKMVPLIRVPVLNDSMMIANIYNSSLENGQSYQMLDYLSNKIGGRQSGSPMAAAAVEWARQELIKFGFDSVYLQPVMVPHWVRGSIEKAKLFNTHFGEMDLSVCALGGSIGTDELGLMGNIIEVKSFEDLKNLGEKNIKGKVVFYNRRFDPKEISTFVGYGKAGNQRGQGAIEAAKYGAIGVIVRSLTPEIDDYPHTGYVGYDEKITKIPAIAISTLDAEFLSKTLLADATIKINITLSAKWFPNVLSYNVIGENFGSEDQKIILVSGHLDAWDTGSGAHDDGAGCVQAIESLRLLKINNYKSKHRLRVTLYMDEEYGGTGSFAYADSAKKNQETHIAALESDAGGLTVRGFSIESDLKNVAKVQAWSNLFEPYGIHSIEQGFSGEDIVALKDQGPVLIGLLPDGQRYFNYHHTPKDIFSEVNQRELELGAAAFASLIYLIDSKGL
jgi:carboxypeptidase Q